MHHSTEYIADIEKYPPATFHYMHNMLPHQPFRYLPSGRLYDDSSVTGVPIDPVEHKRHIKQKRHAHILQVALADTMLGRCIAEFKRLDLFDESLIVVVADHGIIFEDDLDERILSKESFGSIGFVPLIIKYPNQVEGAVDSRNVQTIDIAPTILDLFNIENPPIMDGRSLIAGKTEIPPSKQIMNRNDTIFEFSKTEYSAMRTADHQNAIDFYSLNNPDSTLFHYGLNLNYMGLPESDLQSLEIPCEIDCPGIENLYSMDLASDRIHARLKGTLSCSSNHDPENLIVAVTVNGRVEAVTKPFISMGAMKFNTTLPDHIFRQGENDVKIHLLPDNEHE